MPRSKIIDETRLSEMNISESRVYRPDTLGRENEIIYSDGADSVKIMALQLLIDSCYDDRVFLPRKHKSMFGRDATGINICYWIPKLPHT